MDAKSLILILRKKMKQLRKKMKFIFPVSFSDPLTHLHTPFPSQFLLSPSTIEGNTGFVFFCFFFLFVCFFLFFYFGFVLKGTALTTGKWCQPWLLLSSAPLPRLLGLSFPCSRLFPTLTSFSYFDNFYLVLHFNYLKWKRKNTDWGRWLKTRRIRKDMKP